MRLRVSIALAVALVARDAAAVDPFEIQVYDGRANEPGSVGLELHANRVFRGVRTATPPELPLHQQTHFTLEPAVGVTPWFEMGSYFQTTLRADGTFDYAGTKLRTKFVTPPRWHEHVRLGMNLEFSLLPARYDRNRWGGEIRPIAAWENDRWLFVINPIVDVSRQAPSFEPAGMVKIKLADVIAMGFEYYSAIDDREHYLYEVVDLLSLPRFELNAGVGEGLTGASNAFVAKMILGYSWEP